MRIWRYVSLAAVVAVFSLFAAAPASADERTIVFQANLTVPIVGTTALGTLTSTFDDVTHEGTWSFQGTINGQFAQSSGTGYSTLTDGATPTLTVVMTSIDSWQMPGIGRLATPASATIRFVGELAYVSFGPAVGVPVAVSPDISFPLTSGTYVLTNAGAGEQGVGTLPNTGDSASGSIRSMDVALGTAAVVVGLGLVAGLAAALTLRNRQPTPINQ